ncbi:MAG: M23 family metallopeptidase [Acidimicrobiia bacterium]
MPFVLLVVILGLGCPLQPPVPGAVVRPFAPDGAYGGHWGVDLAADKGSVVRAADFGVVTFAGPVAGRLSVTIHHGGGVRTSYSYLSNVVVSVGSHVALGDIVGTSGTDHGRPVVHYSLRIGSIYRAPPILSCVLVPADGLRLRGRANGRGVGGLGSGPRAALR